MIVLHRDTHLFSKHKMHESRICTVNTLRINFLICTLSSRFPLAACLNLLLNLAEDIKVEMKMVNRRIVPLLSKCIQDRDAVPSLLISATNFLLKLSVYAENKEDMVCLVRFKA